VIGRPLNDRACLGKLSELARAATDDADVRQLAARFQTPRELAAYLRTLPQRNDVGDPDDGPKIACAPPQRARLLPRDPNCFERTLAYLAVAEVIDPAPLRQGATFRFPGGRHTFPVEDGEVPVQLDPRVPRNALAAGLYALCQQQSRGGWRSTLDILEWIAAIAEEPAGEGGELARVQSARRAFRHFAGSATYVPHPDTVRDMALTLRLAERQARMWGSDGVHAVRRARRAVRNLTLGRLRLRLPSKQELLHGGKIAGRVAGRVAKRVLPIAVRAKLAALGIPPSVIESLEGDVAAEGATLGPLAHPEPATELDRFLLFAFGQRVGGAA